MSTKPITENTLFYGDNLKVLRGYIPNEYNAPKKSVHPHLSCWFCNPNS